MWVAFVFMAYLVLALLIPAAWVLVPVWRSAREPRTTNCPALDRTAVIHLDPWFAARMRASGEDRMRVRDCGFWPERSGCGRECLRQIANR